MQLLIALATAAAAAKVAVVGREPAHVVAVASFDVLGPFVTSKDEVEGWPFAHNVTALAEAAPVLKAPIPSELVAGGEVTRWLAKPAGADGRATIEFAADWQKLVRGLGGHEILEWQALVPPGARRDASTRVPRAARF